MCTDFVCSVSLFRHSGGTFNLAIFNVDVTSVVKLGNDTNRHLSVSSVRCDAGVGGVNIQFHGGSRYSRRQGEEDNIRGDTDVKM